MSDEGYLCHDSIVDLDMLNKNCSNCLCKFFQASVTEEDIFVNKTLFPMFLFSSSDNSEDNSCVRISTRLRCPRSKVMNTRNWEPPKRPKRPLLRPKRRVQSGPIPRYGRGKTPKARRPHCDSFFFTSQHFWPSQKNQKCGCCGKGTSVQMSVIVPKLMIVCL